MTHSAEHPSEKLVSSFLLCVIAVFFQMCPLFLGRPFQFVTLIAVIPLCILISNDISRGVTSAITIFLIICLLSPVNGFLFLLTTAPISLVLGITANKHYSKLLSILALGLLLSATLLCTQHFLSFPVLILQFKSPYLTIGWSLLTSMILSIVFHLLYIPIHKIGKMF